MTKVDGRRFDAFVTFLTAACLGLAVVSLLLACQNRALKTRLAADGRAPATQADAVKPGDRVERFAVLDAAGRKSTIGFGEGEAETILLVFSSTCPACQQAIPRWKEVFGSAPSGAVRVLAVQTDRADPKTDAAPLLLQAMPFPIYSQDGQGLELMKKVPYIPATVILDANGVVTRAWFGVPTKEQEEELRLIAGA